MNRTECKVCFHHCNLEEGQTGICKARKNTSGQVVSTNYGKLTSVALDPIEKKPLAFYRPGSKILSIGSFGCNLSCPFCQNYEIADAKEEEFSRLYQISPKELVEIAKRETVNGNIGVAYTYNEALVGYEYVRDCAKLLRREHMANVLVTNGCASMEVAEEVIPLMDAINIDVKGFRQENYDALGGDLESVKRFVIRAAESCHVELTTLIVPGLNDGSLDMEEEAKWIASIDKNIPLHITRYFPRYKMREPATDIETMKVLKEVADKYLTHVLLGNV
ncbi:MAG: AmmeMemoRadiSam system radical SAM enzyme [Lachnospiraceae bacterium]|nr:AmmeMemoRadiSam system radical SAM enzyme [Lachnospiraceae bacterium]